MLVGQAVRIILSTTPINIAGYLQRVCVLRREHPFVPLRGSPLAAARIATSFDRRATIARTDVSHNIYGC